MGDINEHLAAYEKSLESGDEDYAVPLAKSILVLMVKGLFSSLKFRYAQFPCSTVRGSQLYPIVWEAVCYLDMLGFRVLGLTCDGLAHMWYLDCKINSHFAETCQCSNFSFGIRASPGSLLDQLL
jgi:hypothetical protein